MEEVEQPVVFVARHCHYRPTDGRLSDEGRLQAAAIAARLGNVRIGLILHSPAVRCAETARIAWEGLGREPRAESAMWLREDAWLDHDWLDRLKCGGGVLLVTHAPVIRQLTPATEAARFGEVTRIGR